jgi:hypothetical protein
VSRRYRIEYGWGDRGQALYAHFQADSVEDARIAAVTLLHRIRINGAWIVQDDDGGTGETLIPIEQIVDEARWIGPGS